MEERFTIPHECIGYAMGKQGWNVNQARKIDGVISIEFDDYRCMFIVKSEVRGEEEKQEEEECGGRKGWGRWMSRDGYQVEHVCSISLSLSKTVEAAKEARRMLEFTREVIHVSRDLAGSLVACVHACNI